MPNIAPPYPKVVRTLFAASRPPVVRRSEGPFMGGLALLGVAIGFAVALGMNARGLLTGFLAREAREFRWVVFLKDGADGKRIEEKLLGIPGIRATRYVSKEEALGRAQDVPALVEGLRLAVRNPMPASYEVAWDLRFLRPDILGPAADKVGAVDGVWRVGYDRSRLDRMALLARLEHQWDLLGGVLLWAGSATLVALLAVLLFYRLTPLEWRAPVMGAAAGLGGGVLGTLIAMSWLGHFYGQGILAGWIFGTGVGLFRSLINE